MDTDGDREKREREIEKERRFINSYLFVSKPVVWLEGEAEYLPEENPEGPDVGLHGVLVVQDGLQRHPTDRNGVALVTPVVILIRSSLLINQFTNFN